MANPNKIRSQDVVWSSGTGWNAAYTLLGDGTWGARDSFWEEGSGFGSLQTYGNGADASGSNSFAVGSTATAPSGNSIAIGSASDATGISSIAIGSTAVTALDSSIAIGRAPIVSGEGSIAIGKAAYVPATKSIAIGFDAQANINNTVQIQGTLITRAHSSPGEELLFGSSAIVTITTAEIDLKTVADTTITIPTGCRFYPDGVDLIITEVGGTFTGQPTIRSGITGTLDKLLAAIPTVGLAAIYDRQCFTVASRNGESTVTAGVTSAATGNSTIKGRFVFKGILIENS